MFPLFCPLALPQHSAGCIQLCHHVSRARSKIACEPGKEGVTNHRGGERQIREGGQSSGPAPRSVLEGAGPARCPLPDLCTSTRGTAGTFQTGSRATGGRTSVGLGRYGRHLPGAAHSCCFQSGWWPGPRSTSPSGLPALPRQQNLDVRGSRFARSPDRSPAVMGWLEIVKPHSECSHQGKLAP